MTSVNASCIPHQKIPFKNKVLHSLCRNHQQTKSIARYEPEFQAVDETLLNNGFDENIVQFQSVNVPPVNSGSLPPQSGTYSLQINPCGMYDQQWIGSGLPPINLDQFSKWVKAFYTGLGELFYVTTSYTMLQHSHVFIWKILPWFMKLQVFAQCIAMEFLS